MIHHDVGPIITGEPRYKSTMERMSSVAERLRSLQLDEEESQRLQLMRRTEERSNGGRCGA